FSNSNFQFVLKYAGRPKQAHDVRFLLVAKTSVKIRRTLPQVSGCTWNLPFLLESAGRDLHFGANPCQIVMLDFQGEFQPIVPAASIVPKQHGGQIVLSDE